MDDWLRGNEIEIKTDKRGGGMRKLKLIRKVKDVVRPIKDVLTRPLISDALPSLRTLTTFLEGWRWHSLGQIIGLLLLCIDLDDVNSIGGVVDD